MKTSANLPLFPESPITNHQSRLYAGVDEAGRGPLAGPVAVAAVVFDPARPRINGLDDSKALTATRREQLFDRIIERALAYHIVMVEVAEIDQINIFQATMQGMRRAVEGVAHVAGFARIDGNKIPKGLPCAAESLVGGDALDRAISAASILAKVSRDRYRLDLHQRHPESGFDSTRATAPRRIWPRCACTAPAPNTGAASLRCAQHWPHRRRCPPHPSCGAWPAWAFPVKPRAGQARHLQLVPWPNTHSIVAGAAPIATEALPGMHRCQAC